MKILLGLWLACAGMLCGAGLTFPEKLQEISAGVDSAKVTAHFKFTNESDQPVTVTKMDGGCSCMGVAISDGKMKYAPGESGSIQAIFEMGNFSGTVDKAIGIWFEGNTGDEPSVQLTVRVHIPVLISMEPKTLKWPLDSKPVTQKIKIKMSGEKPIGIVSINTASKNFKHELKTIEDGKLYELSITPENTATAGLAVFRIETDCESPRHKIQQVFTVIPRAGKP